MPRYRDHPSPTALPQAGCLLEIEGFAPNYRSEQPYSVRLPPPCRLVLGPLEQVPLQKHCDRCGCRESHVGSNHNSHVRDGPQVRSPQQPSLVVHCEPAPTQQVPFSQIPPQHSVLAVQEPLSDRQKPQKPLLLQIPLQH